MNDTDATHLDLFSGIGGFALAAEWAGFRTVGFCEIEPYAQRVLAERFGTLADTAAPRCNGQAGQHDGGLPLPPARSGQCGRGTASLHGNIFTLDGTGYRGVSLLTGGFPCQPFSVAGKRRGAADDRHLWPEMLRVIAEARPAWVLGENVPGIIPMELDNVLSDLERIGYACRPFVIPACAVDARHRRDRLWVVGRNMADSDGSRSQGRNGAELRECAGERAARPQDSSLPHAENSEPNGRWHRSGWGSGLAGDASPDYERRGSATALQWLPEPDVGRVAHGVSRRVDRLKGLGNAIVPQVAFEILREIRALIG